VKVRRLLLMGPDERSTVGACGFVGCFFSRSFLFRSLFFRSFFFRSFLFCAAVVGIRLCGLFFGCCVIAAACGKNERGRRRSGEELVAPSGGVPVVSSCVGLQTGGVCGRSGTARLIVDVQPLLTDCLFEWQPDALEPSPVNQSNENVAANARLMERPTFPSREATAENTRDHHRTWAFATLRAIECRVARSGDPLTVSP
jgi:hypothetical protein